MCTGLSKLINIFILILILIFILIMCNYIHICVSRDKIKKKNTISEIDKFDF